MSYTLVSTKYIPASGGVTLMQGVKGNRVPRGALWGGNGSFAVLTDCEPAEFELYFKDSEGKKHCYKAYYKIKSTMTGSRLTEKRRTLIKDEVKKIAKESSVYEPAKWVEEAVRKLKI